MRKLEAILQPLKSRGICLRIEPENKLILSGAVGSMRQKETDGIKRSKSLLILIVPEGRSFTIAQILEAINKMILYSEGLVVDAGYEMHSADLKALPIGRFYLGSFNIN